MLAQLMWLSPAITLAASRLTQPYLESIAGPGRDDAGAALGDDAQPRDAHAAQADHRGCRHVLFVVQIHLLRTLLDVLVESSKICVLRKLIIEDAGAHFCVALVWCTVHASCSC